VIFDQQISTVVIKLEIHDTDSRQLSKEGRGKTIMEFESNIDFGGKT
jgi:hypothetical protein